MSFNDRKICHSGEGYVLAICLKKEARSGVSFDFGTMPQWFLVSIEIVVAICTLIAII